MSLVLLIVSVYAVFIHKVLNFVSSYFLGNLKTKSMFKPPTHTPTTVLLLSVIRAQRAHNIKTTSTQR